MADASPTRRQLLRPSHLLALSLAAAIFAGVVVLVTMGFFQWKGEQLQPLVVQQALLTAGVCAGLSFIAIAVGLPLLMLFVDPADFGAHSQAPSSCVTTATHRLRMRPQVSLRYRGRRVRSRSFDRVTNACMPAGGSRAR